MDHEFVPSKGVSNFAPGAGFALLDADIGWRQIGLPHASQSFLQRTAAAVTPSMTTTGAPLREGFNGVAVALKVAPAGGAAPAGIRIGKIVHFTSPTPPNTWVFQFPTTGNLIVGVVCQKEIINVTSVTDSKGNIYTKVAPFADVPQFWFAANATPDPDLHITVHSAGTPVNSSFLWYDVSGADAVPLDGQVAVTGAGIDVGSNSIADAPLITPQSLGLTLSAISFGTGPATGLNAGSPPLAIFDYVRTRARSTRTAWTTPTVARTSTTPTSRPSTTTGSSTTSWAPRRAPPRCTSRPPLREGEALLARLDGLAQLVLPAPDLAGRVALGELGRLEDLTDLHLGAAVERRPLEPLDGLFLRLHLPEPEAGDQLLGLGEGAVDDGRASRPRTCTRSPFELGWRPSPASITPALTSSSLNFPISASIFASGITPASDSLLP